MQQTATYTARVRSDDDRLDGLLRDWHHWKHRFVVESGYRNTAAGCSNSRSRYHTSDRETMDAVSDNLDMETMDACITAIKQPWQNVLVFMARNLTSRAMVWTGYRMATGELLEIQRIEARNALKLQLHSRGFSHLLTG